MGILDLKINDKRRQIRRSSQFRFPGDK